MASNKRPSRIPDDDLLARLFGDAAELSDDDLDVLYKTVAPGESPIATLHRIADQAAAEYRGCGKKLPDHLQAALDATQLQTSQRLKCAEAEQSKMTSDFSPHSVALIA